jgi:hypothetical protein
MTIVSGLVATVYGLIILENKMSMKNYFISIVLCGVVLGVSMFGYQIRKSMTSGIKESLVDSTEVLSRFDEALTAEPLNYNYVTVFIISECPNGALAYAPFASVIRSAVFFLPSSRFPEIKPEDPNWLISEAIFGTWGATVPPNLNGLCYMEFFGYIGGATGMLILGFGLTSLVCYFLGKSVTIIIAPLFAIASVFLFRGSLYECYVVTVMMFIVLFVVNTFYRLVLQKLLDTRPNSSYGNRR